MPTQSRPIAQVRNREAGKLGKALLLFDRESLGHKKYVDRMITAVDPSVNKNFPCACRSYITPYYSSRIFEKLGPPA